MPKVEIDLDAITSELDALKDQRARLKFELNNTEKEIEKRELQLVALLNQAKVDSMEYKIYSFGFKTVTRTAFDQRLFKEENPKLFDKYYLPKEQQKFDFKINK